MQNLLEEELMELTSIEAQKKALKLQMEELNKREEELKSKFVVEMQEKGEKTVENEALKVTYVAPIEKVTIDAKALKNDLPEIYEKYKVVSASKPSLRITLKKGE